MQLSLEEMTSTGKRSKPSTEDEETEEDKAITLPNHAGILAHGAGAGADSDWMKTWTSRLNELMTPTASFDFPCK